jgi:membrane-bound lytic murein transglycosylase A
MSRISLISRKSIFGQSLQWALVCLVAHIAWADVASPFKKVAPTDLPELGMEGDLESFKTALKRQIVRCREQNLKEVFQFGDRKVTRQSWCVDSNQAFLKLAQGAKDFAELMKKARDQFDWYQSEGRDGKGEVMFTGYHCPTIHASLLPTSEYSVPLYRKPADLVKTTVNGRITWRRKNPDGSLSMHYTRKDVDLDGALHGLGLEMAYSTDPFTVSNLQTEGSGVIVLHHADGSQERRFLNYAASNGHPWVSITQMLREEGVPEESLSIPGIRKYFQAHPEKLIPTLMKNPSYVYFQFGTNGPYGADSVVLSPRHSIAIDPKVFPHGAVTLFHTQRPEMKGDEVASWREFATLAITQDIGGAIQGPGRVDIYWGDDEYAEQAAGRMHHLGRLFVALLPEKTP